MESRLLRLNLTPRVQTFVSCRLHEVKCSSNKKKELMGWLPGSFRAPSEREITRESGSCAFPTRPRIDGLRSLCFPARSQVAAPVSPGLLHFPGVRQARDCARFLADFPPGVRSRSRRGAC